MSVIDAKKGSKESVSKPGSFIINLFHVYQHKVKFETGFFIFPSVKLVFIVLILLFAVFQKTNSKGHLQKTSSTKRLTPNVDLHMGSVLCAV